MALWRWKKLFSEQLDENVDFEEEEQKLLDNLDDLTSKYIRERLTSGSDSKVAARLKDNEEVEE